MAFVNPRVYGNLCARRWDKRGGGTAPGGPGARGTLQGPCPRGMHRMGGSGMPPSSQPPRSRAACPTVGHPPGLPVEMAWRGTRAGARRDCRRLSRAVCAQGCRGGGWHCRDPLARVGICCGSEPAGFHGWPCPGTVPGTGPAQGDGGKHAASMGSRISQHKTQALTAHVCACACPSDTIWAHTWHTWARIYARYHGAVQAASWYDPPMHPAAPCGPTGGLWVPACVAGHCLQSWAQP